MHSYSFSFFGHENIVGTHKNTVEFTKEKNLTKRGDCIVGVSCGFDTSVLKTFSSKKVLIRITVDDEIEKITADYNPDFSDLHELVIRRSNFKSSRTFATFADKVAIDINRKLIEKLKNPNIKGTVLIEELA
ncbi:MAG: DUF371 domain-containing protein [archaeon]